MFEIRKSFEGRTVVLEVSGRITTDASEQLEAEFEKLFTAGEEDIAVDLGKCEHISSSGLKVLASAQEHAVSSQGKLVFRNLPAEAADTGDPVRTGANLPLGK